MTLPAERTTAVNNAREFLLKLSRTASQGGFPRVPPDVRLAARRLLKHYPNDFELEAAAKQVPDIFGISIVRRT